MINTIVFISAITVLVLIIVSFLVSPFFIGKERKPYDALGYTINLITLIPIFIIVGRTLGWW